MHGDEAKTAEVNHIMELEERLARGDTLCFIVITKPPEEAPNEQSVSLARQ